MLKMYSQNLNKKKERSRFELWKSGNIWEEELELKQNWLDKGKPVYIKLHLKNQHKLPRPMKNLLKPTYSLQQFANKTK